ncbi:MAG TPA: type II and III secretion system protein family protein [Tepidisphaeraceae bacterium]|nr:type II and III secretion system protein family protein [Tepidisphaeraceae bacterium]
MRNTEKKKSRNLKLLGGAMVAVLAVVQATTAQQATAPQSSNAQGAIVSDGVDGTGRIKLTVNKTAVITTKVPYKRVSVGQADIADVNPIGPGNILVTAKKIGSTQVIIWDDAERSQVIDVTVEFDLQAMQDQLKAMFPDSKIEVTTLNGTVALRGRVPNLQTAEQAVAIASPYSAKVLNFLEVSGGKQVMLQVRFAEVSRSAVSQLGINGDYASGAFLGGSNIGQVNPSSALLKSGTVGATPPFSGVSLDGATPLNPGITVYGAGQIGNFYLEYFIQALRQNNLLRMLAEPNLITISGQEADFLAGGEFPVPVTQGGGSGGVAITVEYRQFGVKLKFVPVVLGDGHIRLKCSPEVSDLDFSTAVRLNGFVIPGLTSRKVDTSIELAEGQTFAIAGLLNNSVTANKDVTPILGDLPVVGALFRSVRYQRKETELVVLVTPRLVSPMNPDEVPAMPGEKWRDPNEMELFWGRDLGSEIVEPKKGSTTQPAVHHDAMPAASVGFTPAQEEAVNVKP